MLKQKTAGFQGMLSHPPLLPFPCLPNFGASMCTWFYDAPYCLYPSLVCLFHMSNFRKASGCWLMGTHLLHGYQSGWYTSYSSVNWLAHFELHSRSSQAIPLWIHFFSNWARELEQVCMGTGKVQYLPGHWLWTAHGMALCSHRQQNPSQIILGNTTDPAYWKPQPTVATSLRQCSHNIQVLTICQWHGCRSLVGTWGVL
jgi:hypothetical protein